MAKILLVEDDTSLREIYSIRLTAEGYDVAVAGDGEEALALAVKERPDLILSDVMMPKISGFDMLDILRSTPETKDMKVIMMTALSSEDQRQRGVSLGANRYLVKSQVGIEDVVNTIHEVMGDTNNFDASGTIQTSTITPSAIPAEQTAPQVTPAQPVMPQGAAQPAQNIAQPAQDAEKPVQGVAQPVQNGTQPVQNAAQPAMPQTVNNVAASTSQAAQQVPPANPVAPSA